MIIIIIYSIDQNSHFLHKKYDINIRSDHTLIDENKFIVDIVSRE